MTAPRSAWYAEFFCEEYWRFANVEYDSERTRHEVAYLVEVLAAAPGRRVLDIGCGPGRHAVPLAQAGFDVIGVDVSAWAVEEAAARAKAAGVDNRARFVVADVLAHADLPVGDLDAALAVQSFGWGSDADQRRLLKAIRRRLVPGGVLILDFSNVLWVTANYVEHAEADAGGRHFTFVRSYDAISGRSRGEVRISGGDGEVDKDVVLRDDVRLYTPAEVVAMVGAAGFDVRRVDAAFVAGGAVTRATRYAQVVATAVPVPPRALGLATTGPPDTEGALDLRWALDEWDWVEPSPGEVWHAVTADADAAIRTARSYRLDDPFGSRRGAAAVSAHLGHDIDPDRLLFAGGATALLRHAGELAEGGTVVTVEGAHPDLPAWTRAVGSRIEVVPAPHLESAIADLGPELVLVDRPGIAGETFTVDDLVALAEAASTSGGTVVIDESYANYLAPAASAARAASELDNLVVIRGFSKAYSWGGLRVGYAVCSSPQARRLTETLPPLNVSELALAVALYLLDCGDVAGRLRTRLADVKPTVAAALRRVGLDVDANHPALPWLLLDDGDGRATRRLRERGIASKQLRNPGKAPRARVSVPLNTDRVDRCLELLA